MTSHIISHGKPGERHLPPWYFSWHLDKEDRTFITLNILPSHTVLGLVEDADGLISPFDFLKFPTLCSSVFVRRFLRHVGSRISNNMVFPWSLFYPPLMQWIFRIQDAYVPSRKKFSHWYRIPSRGDMTNSRIRKELST